MNVRVTIGPAQPSRHRRPDDGVDVDRHADVGRPLRGRAGQEQLLDGLAACPAPGFMPVNASTVAVSRPLGLVRAKPSIGMPFETSDRIADHSGAEVSSESLPSLGELSELPIQTPATSAGSVLVRGRGEEAVGVDVAVVARRAGLVGGGPDLATR